VSKAKNLSDIKNLPVMKKLLIILVVIILLVVAGYYVLAPDDCTLGNERVYAGQPVDNEQAIAKLTGFINNLNRTQFPAGVFSIIPELSSLVLKETRVTRVKTTNVLLGDAQVQVSGFMMDVPHTEGDRLVYGDGYFISEDNDYLYKTNKAC